jgi:hypothetical protein
MNVSSLGSQALGSAPSRKAIQMKSEPVTLADGSTLPPLSVKTPHDALRATLLMLFKHVADVHITIVEIIAEKYGLHPDEIHSAITSDPRWTEMLNTPLITDLTRSTWEKAVPAKAKKPIKIVDAEELVFD